MKIDTTGLSSFIPESEIFQWLEKTKNPEPERVREVIQKSLNKNRLDPEEMAILINAEDPALVEEIFEGARELKQRIYGNRIVLFAPLYIGNECINNCQYCGFRCTNKEVSRKTLTMPELDREIEALVKRGHKRLILVYGEHPQYAAQFIHDTVMEVYKQKHGNGEIRRVNINAAPLDIEGFKLVKSAGIGTYQIFQETYHQETYKQMHPSGPKSSFLWRLHGLDRAQQAGIDDVGIGALMGLFDWRFETMALLYHTIHLEEKFNVGPHTISFPRIEPAIGTAMCDRPPHEVSDYDFKRLVAILRLAVPYTGLILTCRESVELRNEIIQFGVSQIDAGSLNCATKSSSSAFRRLMPDQTSESAPIRRKMRNRIRRASLSSTMAVRSIRSSASCAKPTSFPASAPDATGSAAPASISWNSPFPVS